MFCKEYFTFTKVLLGVDSIASSKPMDKETKRNIVFKINVNNSKTPGMNLIYGKLNNIDNFNPDNFLSDKIEEKHTSLKHSIIPKDWTYFNLEQQ